MHKSPFRDNGSTLETSDIESDGFRLSFSYSSNTTIHQISDSESGISGFCWGTLFDVSTGSFAPAVKRLLDVANGKDPHILNDNGGLYVAILFDQKKNRLVLVNDCLGLRPLYVTEQNGDLYGASHALSLIPVISGRLKANLDAVSQYLVYGFNGTEHSLLNGVDRLGAASVTEWAPEKKRVTYYNDVSVVDQPIGQTAMAEKVYGLVARSYKNWTQGVSSLSFGLSGGYDSRFLCALSADNDEISRRYINVSSYKGETIMAEEVAKRLNIPLEVAQIHGNEFDAYAPESLFHLRPGGFPVTKSVCRLVFRQAPEARMVDGYMGDSLIRGHMRGNTGSLFGPVKNLPHSQLKPIILKAMSSKAVDIFRQETKRALLGRAHSSASEYIDRYYSEGHTVTAFDLFMRQRSYISNNFLQNLNEAEPCLPFYDPELVALKRSYPYTDFSVPMYREIFKRFMPDLADLQHNDDLKIDKVQPTSRIEKRWALSAWPRYALGEGREYLNTGFVNSRLAVGMVWQRYAYVIRPLMFLDMLVKTCAEHNIAIEWDELNDAI